MVPEEADPAAPTDTDEAAVLGRARRLSGLPKAGTVVAGKYRIQGLVSSGGMGAVFEAAHCVTGKRVAIKWLLSERAHKPKASLRLVREAEAAGHVSHPNVVDV